MTTSISTNRHPGQPGHSAVRTIAVAIVAGSAVFGLLIAALTFGALAIAFPLAVPIAAQFHVAVSPSDVAIAERFADLWWIFASFALSFLLAAAVVVVRTLGHFENLSRQ